MPVDPVAATVDALDRIDASDRSEVWIHLAERAECIGAAELVATRMRAGEALPLAGLVAAVKNNIDVAGWPTTAGCPAYAYTPAESAAVVDRLRDAGAVIVGATNMDQFATGLVGTRSPYGAVRNAVCPEYIAGGSSSGSAVAVALGLVDLALGTDTAGSGRVPAAMNGIVGFKPTRGRLSTRGVVPASRSFDCVSVFAATVSLAAAVADALAGFDPLDPRSRRPRSPRPRRAGPIAVGIPDARSLAADPDLDHETRSALTTAADTLARIGVEIIEVDLAPFLEAGALLYGGAFAAERYDAVGKFIDAHVDAVDPVVGSIITAARDRRAHELARDLDRLATLARRTDATWEECDAVMLPTVPTAFTIAAIDAEPMVHNTVLGRYTSFCNLLDLAAVAVPVAERTDGLPIGVTFVGPAWTDEQLARIASAFVRPGRLPFDGARSGLVSVVVVGAHLAGQPLNSQLVDRGGRLVAATTTAPEYRLYALDGELPKPALVRVLDGGAAIEVEVWELDEAAFGSFVASIPGPHCIGRVHLADGTEQPGFLCEPAALGPARDITRFGGWRAYLEWASSTARAQ